MNDESDITLIDTFNFNQGFTVQELVPLLNHECIKNIHKKYLPKPPVDYIGIVCGILTMNSEVELLVQFPEGIEQLSKSEFNNNYQIVED